jgi:hypothetical protein
MNLSTALAVIILSTKIRQITSFDDLWIKHAWIKKKFANRRPKMGKTKHIEQMALPK